MTPEEKRKRLNELFAKMVNFDSSLSAEEELEFQSLNNDPEVSEAKERASEPMEMLRKETSPEKVKEDLKKKGNRGHHLILIILRLRARKKNPQSLKKKKLQKRTLHLLHLMILTGLLVILMVREVSVFTHLPERSQRLP